MKCDAQQKLMLEDAHRCLIKAYPVVRRSYERSLKKLEKETKKGNAHYAEFAQKQAMDREELMRHIEHVATLIASSGAAH